MANDIVQTIRDAEADAQTLEDVINGAPDVQVKSRLGRMMWTLATINRRVDSVYVEANNAINTINQQKNDVKTAYNDAMPLINNSLSDINTKLNSKLGELDAAIESAAADSLAEKGWSDLLVTTANGRTLREKNAENVSVWDFFTKEELAAYKAAPTYDANNPWLSTYYDASRPLQAFFDYIHINDVGVANCTGVFFTSKTIRWGNGTTTSKTKTVRGDFRLIQTVNASVFALFKINPGREYHWQGNLWITGIGGTNYANRTVDVGLHMGGGTIGSAHFTISGAINIDGGFKQIGVFLDNITTATNIGVVQTTRCGSGKNASPAYGIGDNWSLRANFSNRVDRDVAGEIQNTTLTVDVLPPDNLVTGCMITVNDTTELHYIQSIDRENSTINVRGFIDTNHQTGGLRYTFGAGIYIVGGDASVPRIFKHSSKYNGVSVWIANLYPPIIDNLTAEYNGVALVLGRNPQAALVGGQLNGFYCESNDFDLVKLSAYDMSFNIVSSYAPSVARWRTAFSLRDVANNTRIQDRYDGITLVTNRSIIQSENPQSYGATYTLDITSDNRVLQTIISTGMNINLAAPDVAKTDGFGIRHKRISVVRSTGSGIPPNPVVFNAPLGYTINNGQTSVSFNGFIRPPVFDIVLNTSKSFVISTTDLAPLSASVTYTPPSLAAATQQSTTVTLTGVTVNDTVAVSFNRPLQGTRMWGEVTSTNTVAVYHRNDTGETVDVASGTLRVKVI